VSEPGSPQCADDRAARAVMDPRARRLFLALVAAQAAHSLEEYAFGLYQVFAPARLVSELVSQDAALGFVVLNAGFVAFGVWCYVARVRPDCATARAWAWPWVFVELGNGVGHPILSWMRGAYLPGVGTAPILLLLAVALAVRLVRHPVVPGTPAGARVG